MTDQRHNAAFVVGSILGGVAGAAAALWKTPQSGPELRAKLAERLGMGGGTTGRAASPDAPDAVHVAKASTPSSLSSPSKPSKVWDIWNARTSPETRTFGGSSGVGGKVLSVVEKATAPIVGVKLGETAREAGSRALSGAASVVRPGGGATTGAPPVTPPEEPATAPAFESSGEITEAGVGHVASTEELVAPAVPVETQSTEKATGPLTDFPAFDADDRDRTT